MAGELAQAEERLEDLHRRALHPILRDPLCDRSPVVGEELVVLAPVLRLELAIDRLLPPRGKLGRHFLLRPSEEERPDPPREELARLVVELARPDVAAGAR